MKKIVQLHTHSTYSLLDSVLKIEELVKYTKENELKAACLTEHGTLASTYELWKQCKAENIKPILGIEGYYVDAYDNGEGLEKSYAHIVLLCKNYKGWMNLKRIHLESWKHFYRKPRISFDLLEKYKEGLIVLSACTNGLVGSIFMGYGYHAKFSEDERNELISTRIKKFKKMMGDDFYLEIMMNDLEEQAMVNKKILKLSKAYNLPVVITNDVHYLKDYKLHDIIKCINFKSTLDKPENGTYQTKLLNLADIRTLIKHRRRHHSYLKKSEFYKAIDNVDKIVDKIEKFEICTDKSSLPVFIKNSKEYLYKLCLKGKNIIKNWTEEYESRLQYELSVINKLKMADYFLVVHDIANHARKQNIPFNTRGSVAGSLVAHVIGISWIDPLKFDIPFERFLTEDRISLPDIDMDFGKNGRERLIKYLENKYGIECVAHISNFSTYKPKQAIKDVAKVLGYSFSETNKITKLIPDGVETFEDIPDIKDVNNFLDENKEITINAKKLIGLVRNRGVHASGVVLTNGNIKNWTPVAYASRGEKEKTVKVTEFDMYALEDLDILKLDFLGQNTLDIIKHTVKLVKDDRFSNFDELMKFIINNLEDEKVYKNIRSGNLIGTFQMGTSDGMRKLIVDLKPCDIFDIMAGIALYRSAVLSIGAHNTYLKRRFGEEQIRYLHPKMGDILDKTYGIMLYQENIPSLAVHLAGFTITEADKFRKAVKRKDSDIFVNLHEKFIKGCKTTSNISEGVAENIWGEMLVWSSYGFNRGHSSAYAVIAYLTAWLKVYYPLEFITSLLTHNTDDEFKFNSYYKEAKRLGIDIAYPDINKSGRHFKIANGKLLCPLTVIKGLGDVAVNEILSKRKECGGYKNVEQFLSVVNKRVINVRIQECLIKAGAFKSIDSMENIFIAVNKLNKNSKSVRLLYCNVCKYNYIVSLDKKSIEENGVVCPNCGGEHVNYNFEEICSKRLDEKFSNGEVFTFCIGNVFDRYLETFIQNDVVSFKDTEDCDGDTVKIGCMVSTIKKHVDKNGNEMAFVSVSDADDKGELIIFASQWDVIKDDIKKAGVYVFPVKVDGKKFILRSTQILKCS